MCLYILNTAAELRSHDADSLRLPPIASLRGDKREAHFTSFGVCLVARMFPAERGAPAGFRGMWPGCLCLFLVLSSFTRIFSIFNYKVPALASFCSAPDLARLKRKIRKVEAAGREADHDRLLCLRPLLF